MKEQKPKDLLNKAIKDEPLDEEHFKKNVPNFKELVEPWLQSNSDFFDTSNDEITNSSSQVFKQEPVCSEPRSVVAVENVKMETIDELDDDLGSQMHLNPTIMEKPKRNLPHRRCSVCSQMKPLKFIKDVGSVQDKLIIMIKLVFRGECTVEKAQLFLSDTKNVRICYAHFSEALKEICSALCIQKLEDFRSCPLQLMQSLMPIVNALLPLTSAMDFCDTLNNFATRNQHILQMSLPEMKLEEQESQNLISNKTN